MDFKKWRKEKGLTQTEAAARLSLSASYWSGIESGKSKSFEKRKDAVTYLVLLDDKKLEMVRDFASRITKKTINDSLRKLKGSGYSKKKISMFCGLSPSALSCYSTGSISIEEANLSTRILIAGGLLRLYSQFSRDKKQGQKKEVSQTIIHTSPVTPQSLPDSFEKVPHIMINGEPMWVITDVCRAIDYTNYQNALRLIDEDDQQKLLVTDSMGRKVMQWVCNEPGLYTFLLRSNVPKAKPFKKWVTTEVLPSIRKTGGYQQPQQMMSQIDIAMLSLQEIKRIDENQKALEHRLNLLESKPNTGITLDQVVDVAKRTQKVAEEEVRLEHNRRVKNLQTSEERLVHELMQKMGMIKKSSAYEKTYLTFLKDLRATIKNRVCQNHEVSYTTGWGRQKYEDMDFASAYEELEIFREVHGLSSQIGF